ncbi:hypothetical protein [Streptomyces sp. ITFR-6]|uniref:hypothetical protein n=1 Tax=Streptomyces sp. ITFR-6 TaxID=3075197 RepID=UPI00288ADBB6|nr:hypothetical protein [Streptomyces sp. ITFR-6]WNI28603.1 hypothetical protein RLT59_07250 [Streptomyces sp. ITFR-6]
MTTAQLIRAQRAGAEILHNGAPVRYAPLHAGDRTPWLYTDGRTESRYTANQCTAHVPADE